jgi:hypothetical protein
MKYFAPLAISVLVLGASLGASPALAAAQEPKPKTCRMEQQCHWENFKKICVYVKVCR